MPTLTTYPVAGGNSPVDGNAYRDVPGAPESFATIRAGAGNAVSYGAASDNFAIITSSTTSNLYTRLTRAIYCFDTSALTSSATISAATLSLRGTSQVAGLGSASLDLDIVAATPAATNILANADYGQLGSTVFASVAYGSYSVSGYNDFALDSNGIANVSKTGISKFGSRLSWDTDNSFGGTWASSTSTRFTGYFADQTGTTNDPKLEVTYTTPGGASSGLDIGGPC